MTDIKERLQSHHDSIIEELKNLENPSDFNVLDVNYSVQLDGTITEINLVVTTGGPHIELSLVSEQINSRWASDTAHRHINEHTNPEALEGVNRLFDFYEQQWKAQH